jgi:hypothetical protein
MGKPARQASELPFATRAHKSIGVYIGGSTTVFLIEERPGFYVPVNHKQKSFSPHDGLIEAINTASKEIGWFRRLGPNQESAYLNRIAYHKELGHMKTR